jgi:hypothetical protein
LVNAVVTQTSEEKLVMSAKIVRFALTAALLLGLAGFGADVQAKSAAFVFADALPAGVSFHALAAATASEHRFHAPGTVLERYALDCSQATGKLFTKEQLLFVEWGAVDVRDWTTGKTVATLRAGDAFAPTQEERYVYLTGLQGRMASVLRFGTAAASASDSSVLPDATYETAGCHSGAGSRAPLRAAEAAVLFSDLGAKAQDFALGPTYAMYLGVLTVDPGAGFSPKDASHPNAAVATSTGMAVFAPLVGGLGDAGSGGVGFGEVPGGPHAALFPGMTLGGLVNEGGWPVTILVAGTAPVGQPALQQAG